jgi:hypothetical protein
MTASPVLIEQEVVDLAGDLVSKRDGDYCWHFDQLEFGAELPRSSMQSNQNALVSTLRSVERSVRTGREKVRVSARCR